jgi:hypothetical protein
VLRRSLTDFNAASTRCMAVLALATEVTLAPWRLPLAALVAAKPSVVSPVVPAMVMSSLALMVSRLELSRLA